MEGKYDPMNQLFMQLYYEAAQREQPEQRELLLLRWSEPLESDGRRVLAQYGPSIVPGPDEDGRRPLTLSQFRTAEQLHALSTQFQSRLDAIVPPKRDQARRAALVLFLH